MKLIWSSFLSDILNFIQIHGKISKWCYGSKLKIAKFGHLKPMGQFEAL